MRTAVRLCRERVDVGTPTTKESLHTTLPPSLWQEEDDYESPNDDADAEDDGDYESPNEEEEAPVEDDADYEPPPSNDEEALQNSILPAKPLSNPNSMYIGKGPGAQPPAPTDAQEANTHASREHCVLMPADRLCGFGQVTPPLWASVSLSVK